MKNVELDYNDLRNLVLQFRGLPTAWRDQPDGTGQRSLALCQRQGLCRTNGSDLTQKGREKAERVIEYAEQVRRGIPLEGRRADRQEELLNLKWWRCKLQIGPNKVVEAYACKHYIIGISVATTNSITSALPTKPEENLSLSEIVHKLFDKRGGKLENLEPVAFQINQWPDPIEAVCLRSATGQVTRLAAAFYDYIAARYKKPQFWQKAGSQANPVIIRTAGAGVLGGGVAIAMPIGPKDWVPLSM